MKFSIWREPTGGFLLKEGTTPLHPGDVCFKLVEADNWDQANKELHKFMDQRAKDMATS